MWKTVAVPTGLPVYIMKSYFGKIVRSMLVEGETEQLIEIEEMVPECVEFAHHIDGRSRQQRDPLKLFLVFPADRRNGFAGRISGSGKTREADGPL